jgi:hypothetical protein
MPTCPKGHASEADDYCDVCGIRLAAPAAAGTGGQRLGATTPSTATAQGGARVCAACRAALDGRFCEECGHDSLTPAVAEAPAAVQPVADAWGPGAAAREEADVPDDAAHGGTPGVAVGSWEVVVTADREYFQRMQALRGPDAGAVQFPLFFPERRFALTGPQVLIGRRSRSRGIHPEIDLTGPPEDPAASHLHALLVPLPEGGWAVVDLKSTNYTYVNGSSQAIEPEVPVPLRPGDHVNVGAWTRLTLRPAG